MPARSILVIEDDPAIRRGLVDTLAAGGYRPLEAADGEEGLRLALTTEPAAVLIDVMLPGLDGFSLLEELRRSKPALPVIMVTARGSEEDRVHGLKSGADDYVVKPFSALELLARVEALLRRSAERSPTEGTLDLDGRAVDLNLRQVQLTNGETRELSARETELLQYLASRRGQPISRDELLQHVWGLDPKGVMTRTIDMHVARLRRTLGDDDAELIRTVRGKGYMLA